MQHFSLCLQSILAPVPLRVLPGGADGLSPSDENLVARAKVGDRGACEALVARHIPAVLARAQHLLGRTADAEDVVQDAFIEALRDLAKLQEPARFGAWVKKIAVHQVHRRFRRKKLRRALGLLSQEDDQVLSQLAQDHSDPSVRAQLAEVDVLLAGQSPRDRLAWMLRHVEGLSLPEVAAQMGCSLATAKRSIARVHRCVTAHFGGEIFSEDQS
jgi:RNA polymerase sigma-70 factor (ECF subfamily)